MKKALFIFNPISGQAKIKNELLKIINFYTDHGYLLTIYATKEKGDAHAFVMQLSESFDLIVCGGGDGTVSEVISAMVESRNITPLAYIPSGSTNDLGRSLNITSDLDEALKLSITGMTYSLDVGYFNDTYFSYVAAFGVFTDTSYSTPQQLKNQLGHLAYILSGVKSLSELKPYKLRVKYDDCMLEGEFIFGLISNSFSIAGFKSPWSSDVELNDGLFEVVLIRFPKTGAELHAIIVSLLNGTIDSPYVICFKTANLQMESDGIDWTLDGEYGGKHKKIGVKNINKAVKLIACKKQSVNKKD